MCTDFEVCPPDSPLRKEGRRFKRDPRRVGDWGCWTIQGSGSGYYRRVKWDSENKKAIGQYQHRVVMEHTLGRSLLPGENVHHKNGNKLDNRAENLELWVVYQPSGQRVEDLLSWANEIQRRYGNV